MTPSQVLGWTMLQTTSITSITSTRVWDGDRPENDTLPSINYYEIAGGTRSFGIESIPYSINCRAVTKETAILLARKVVDLFHGTSSTGIYAYQNSSFEISRCSLKWLHGAIHEEEEGSIWNAPVDIQLVYPTNTVS